MIAALVMTDGRPDYLRRTVESLNASVSGPIGERWMFDDTGDSGTYRRELRAEFPDWRHINAGPRQGFGGAIRAAWAQLVVRSFADWVFHVEGDFTFNRPIDLAELVDVMSDRPHLAQMALLRQPWNDDERRVGGVLRRHPGDYAEMTNGSYNWLEHRRFFTTNPSLYARGLCSRGWPIGIESEGRFSIALFADNPATRCAYWGRRDDPPAVEHIGLDRAGTGY